MPDGNYVRSIFEIDNDIAKEEENYINLSFEIAELGKCWSRKKRSTKMIMEMNRDKRVRTLHTLYEERNNVLNDDMDYINPFERIKKLELLCALQHDLPNESSFLDKILELLFAIAWFVVAAAVIVGISALFYWLLPKLPSTVLIILSVLAMIGMNVVAFYESYIWERRKVWYFPLVLFLTIGFGLMMLELL